MERCSFPYDYLLDTSIGGNHCRVTGFFCVLDCGSCDEHSKILTIKVKCRNKMHVFDLNYNMLDVEA